MIPPIVGRLHSLILMIHINRYETASRVSRAWLFSEDFQDKFNKP